MVASAWFERLEKIVYVELFFTILGSLGIDVGYNVALAFFSLFVCHMATAKYNLINIMCTLLSLITDISLLGLHGSNWSSYGKEQAFGMGFLIITLVIKTLSLLVMVIIFSELGGLTSLSHGGVEGGAYNPWADGTAGPPSMAGQAPMGAGSAIPNSAPNNYQQDNTIPSHADTI